MKHVLNILTIVLFALPTLAYSSIDSKQLQSEGIKEMAETLSHRDMSVYYTSDEFFQLSGKDTVISVFLEENRLNGYAGNYVNMPEPVQSIQDFSQTYFRDIGGEILKVARKNKLQIYTASDRGLPYLDYVLVVDPRTHELYSSMSGDD